MKAFDDLKANKSEPWVLFHDPAYTYLPAEVRRPNDYKSMG